MKFGKRLGVEAARGWKNTYLDYKACKRAVRQDVQNQDPTGKGFEAIIQRELKKISAFFAEKEEELEGMMRTLQGREAAVLSAFRAEVLELRKYAVLNSTAVIKAVKKRNRHLRHSLGTTVRPLRAIDLLSQQHFFTSAKLAALSTRAEVLFKEIAPREDAAQTLEEYECPICLSVLQSPVVLTCAHRFCWGCLLSHCATSQDLVGHAHGRGGNDLKEGKPGSALLNAIPEDSSTSRTSTYGCPVCRQAHILDLDRLQVDQTLTAFIETLKLRQREPSIAPSFQPPSPLGSATKAPITTNLRSTPVPCERQSSNALSLPSLPRDSRGGGLLAEVESDSQQSCGHSEAEIEAEEATSGPTPPLLPPQVDAVKGRLTVVLDLDGTLISSFTPRRAPSLPPGSTSYIVGKGAKLNPNGVLVVERPELRQFFAKLNKFAEVVLFTAGLEDYAAPICKELERRYGVFTATLFRPATVPCDAYPCVKDLSRLGRDMKRTILVDDTPLAFLQQPNNGVPIFNFRGDVDDRVLPEAILPLLEQLATAEDVRPILQRRFDMPRWLASHGISGSPAIPKTAASPVKRRLELIPRKTLAAVRDSKAANSQARSQSRSDVLILSDFDKTLTDCDAGERLVGELAPELAPMLAAVHQPANFVPLTNAVLSEMARRGISRDKIMLTLSSMGAELPAASSELLSWASEKRIDLRIISDCNTVFISQILKAKRGAACEIAVVRRTQEQLRGGAYKFISRGFAMARDEFCKSANVAPLVQEVITNCSSFERSMTSDSAKDLTKLESWGSPHAGQQSSPDEESSYRLVIQPRHDESTMQPHACPLCPANLCKGQELEALRLRSKYRRIVYCGDGANDLCPSLILGPSDVVLAREGYDLDRLIKKRSALEDADRRVEAQVFTWQTHEELCQLVKRHASE